MKISCPACAAKYSIADDKVQDRLAKIRCRKCGTTIVIDGKVNPPNVHAADAASHAHEDAHALGDAGHEYTVDLGENDQRPMRVDEIVSAYRAGTVTMQTYVWADGFTDWTPIADVHELSEAIGGGSAHAQPGALAAGAGAGSFPAPAATAASTAASWGAAQPQTPSASRAARSDGGARGTTDLFGRSFDTAGSEEDVATSAAAAAAASAATGARNESSVLFSLSALTSAAATAPKPSSSPSSTAAMDDADSGLIDLKALTAASADKPAADDGGVLLGMAPPLGIAPPLGMAAPFGGGGVSSAADVTYPQPKSKKGLFIIAAAILVVGGFGIYLLRPAEPPPPAVIVAAPAPTPTPTPTPQVTATPPATGTAQADAGKPTAKKGVWRGRKSAGKATEGGETSSGSEAAPAPAAKKPAATPCGCPPGDLHCFMQCEAKGGK